MHVSAMKWFDRITALIFSVLLLFITLGIIIGLIHLVQQLGDLLTSVDAPRHYIKIVSEVLTLFVLIELSRSLVSYFDEHRMRLTFIVDAGIIFVLREVMIKLFEHKIMAEDIYALSALLFVLGSMRTASVLVYQREKRMMAKKRMQSAQTAVN